MPQEPIFQFKNARFGGAAIGAVTAGLEQSWWELEGSPSHGAVPPTSFANPDNTIAGGLLQTNPAGGLQKWLTSLKVSGPRVASKLILWDRLLHMSGFSGTVTTAQNVNGGSAATLSRHYVDANGGTDSGNRIFVEVHTLIGATATTITATYTNSIGVSGQVTKPVAFGGTGNREALRWIELPLAQGDIGVQSITSVTVLATTGTAGNFSVVIAHSLLPFMTGTFVPDSFMGAVDGDIEILTNACLFWTSCGDAAIGTAAIPYLSNAEFCFVDK